MNRPASKSLVGYIISAGVILGILIAWLLPRTEVSTLVRAADQTLTPSADASLSAKAWPIPIQPGPTPTFSWKIVKEGSSAPDFSLDDRDGNPVRLADLRGKIVVLNFWASWCPPCREEMPDLQWLAAEYADEGLVVLGINTTYVDERKDALDFVDELDLTFPILFDETGEVSEGLYSVFGLPTSFWIDRQGVVRRVELGALNRDQMVEMLEGMLK